MLKTQSLPILVFSILGWIYACGIHRFRQLTVQGISVNFSNGKPISMNTYTLREELHAFLISCCLLMDREERVAYWGAFLRTSWKTVVCLFFFLPSLLPLFHHKLLDDPEVSWDWNWIRLFGFSPYLFTLLSKVWRSRIF